MASVVTNDAKTSILNQEFDWSGNTYHLALLTSSHTNNIDTQQYWSDVSTNEASGTNYTAGGQALASLTVTVDDTNDLAYLDATDEVFSNVTVTFRYGVIYENTGTPATSKLVCIIDYGSDLAPISGDFTHQFAADGFLKLT